MSSDKPRVVVPTPRPVAVREIQLIDRDEEMQVLREAADSAAHGEGGVIFLHGEAGIGKTRLARELGAYARSRGMQVLSGRCPALFRMDGVPPYALWEEVIKDYMELCTLEELHKVIGSYPIEVSRLIPELKQKLRLVPESFPLSPEHSRDRLFEAVTQFVTNISREKPLLVILDDLQWTDQSSLLLLHYLARGIYKESLLLLGAYRDNYVDKKHPLSPVLAELNRERLLQSVPLRRMSFDDVVEMVGRILGQDDVPREFGELVYEKTRGNPFFVEEVIKSLKEEKVLSRKGKRWEVKEVSRIQFPETVREVIKGRVDRLDEECQRLLKLASFIGKDFTFEVLKEAAGIEEDKLLELMERMLRTGLVKEREIRGEAVHSFSDIIVRDVVHDEISLLRRKKLHGIIGSALEKVYTEKIDEHLGELALHFIESGAKKKALDYFLKAGEKAAEVYANNEAASYFQSALKLLEEKKGELEERGRILEKLGDIKRLVGEYDACLKYWNAALLLWKQLSQREKVSRLHLEVANIFGVLGDWERVEEHYEKALKILEGEPESAELASLYQRKAGMLWSTGHMAEALPWAEKALELAKKLNALEVIAKSYMVLAVIFGSIGNRRKAIEYNETALKIALDNGFLEIARIVYVNLASGLPAEDGERRLKCLEKGFELAKRMGHIWAMSFAGIELADLHIGTGNMSKAISLAEELVALDRKAGHPLMLRHSVDFLGFVYQVLGEWDKSEQCYKEAYSFSQKLDDYQSIAFSHYYPGLLHFDKGEYVKARDLHGKVYEVFEKAGAKSSQMKYSHFLIWTHIELGEIEKAEKLTDSLRKFALETKDKELIARADMLRGTSFRAQKKWKESLQHFKKSLQGHEAIDARRWNVYWFAKMILCEYARVYLERNQQGDREKAYDLLNQALEIFQKMGAKKNIEKTQSKMIHLETGREMAEPEPVAEAVLPSHVSTGYEELDDSLSGGVPRDYAVMLTSPSCDERDLLIKRFLEAGAKEGQVTFYVTIDPSQVTRLTEEYQSNFNLFVCNPEADSIIKSLPNVSKLKGVENLTDINIALTSAFRRLSKSPKGPRRVCIEIVSDVLLQHHAVSTRRWLTALIPKLKARGFTTLAVMNPQMHSPQEVQAILGLFEGEINLYEKETEKGLQKFLKIKKMTNQKYSKSELSLQEEKLRK